MNNDCLICNTRLGPGKSHTHIGNVFYEMNVLPSSNTLLRTLQEILDKTLNENEVHSKSLCKKCYRSCVDYDEYMSKINILKMDMCSEFNTTIHTTRVSHSMPVLTEEKPKTPVVVPASKLKPIPADFQLNFGSAFNLGQKAKIVTKSGLSSSINLKVTIGTSVLTQSLNTTTVKISAPETTVSTVNTLSTVNVNDISKKWDVSVPQEIFSTNEETSENEVIKNDGGDMEIEEECNLSEVAMPPDVSDPLFEAIKTESGSMPEFTEFITITEGTDGAAGNYVFGKLKIFNSKDGNDEQQTLVIDGDNASVLEMMTGQKVIYENGGLSLVMENDDAAGDAAGDDDDDDDDDDDGQDSNEESQIELQVSGDEETANAIIAAAQEQGGAFIKVESGEMYRVQSVQSHDSNHDVSSLLTRHGNQFSCNLCQRHDVTEKNKLRDANAMMLHLKTDHDAKIYLCQFCGKGMRKRTDYTTHLAEHSRKPLTKSSTQRRIHECSLCNKFYTSRTLLHEHMNTHTGARPYTCDECEKAFASKYSLRAHLKIHQARPRPFQCEQCSKSFLSSQNLKQHEKTHSGLKEFICKFCNKAFSTQHNLEIHGVVHTGVRPFSCQFCDKSFARRAELMDHRRTHTGERPFECEQCGARFAQRSNLHSHRRATHLNDKRHQCPDCPKRFKRRRLLQYHIKATHTGERPLKCEVCLASFVYPEHYKKHLKIHSGARPYVCEICGKSFNSRDNRNMHRFTHSEKKPYECLACGHSYMRKRLLIAHMNQTGHLAESIVVNQPRVTRVLKTDGVTTLVDVDKRAEVHSDKIEAVLRTSGKVESLDRPPAILPRQEARILPEVSFIDTGNLDTGSEQTVVVKEINAADVQQDAVHYGTDENGSVLRLIQVKLPDGNDGWMALND